MPDKAFTTASYIAGASLAAVSLIYVFSPTWLIDGEGSGKKSARSAIGLINVANDCFINSTLQALAGLGDLRLYLIRETHRRTLDGVEVYQDPVEDPARKDLPLWKIDGLQAGIVTRGLKDMLDALNERSLYKKTISAHGFVKTLETAFRQRISRQQQDAQEFLQVVAERLCDEYRAGRRARRKALGNGTLVGRNLLELDQDGLEKTLSKLATEQDAEHGVQTQNEDSRCGSDHVQTTISRSGQQSESNIKTAHEEDEEDDEEGFPFEGTSESQIECMTCGFQPSASKSTFCSLSLNVPQVTSTSLSSCFDGMFKTEHIDDFKCEKCRLVHAVDLLESEMSQSSDVKFRQHTASTISKLKAAIDVDPEKPPSEVELPDSKFAPKRKIARHQRIVKFPKIMAIHLSRSIFDVGRSSMKNSARVTFPEELPLGGILHQKKYKLLGVVTHKGSHHSGHYESFRRQHLYAPFSTPNTFDKSGVYSNTITPAISRMNTPMVSTSRTPERDDSTDAEESSITTPHERLGGVSRDADGSSVRSAARSARSAISQSRTRLSLAKSPDVVREHEATVSIDEAVTLSSGTTATGGVRGGKSRRKKRTSDRWWRISDDKVKECKTNDVLAMQKEVYLLFYEVERENDSP